MTFLIVDDNGHMRDSVRRYLARAIPGGHRFLEASDGEEAVALYDQYTPDWVLMDIEMRRVDGLEALQRIRADHPHAQVIMLTAYDEIAYRETAAAAGARGYVLKNQLRQIKAVMKAGESDTSDSRTTNH